MESENNRIKSLEQIIEIIEKTEKEEIIKYEFDILEYLFRHFLTNKENDNLSNILIKKGFEDLFKAKSLLPFCRIIAKKNLEIKTKLKESFENYNHIIKNFTNLNNELKLSNSLETSILFTYLLYNGYFSINKEHKYSLENRLIIPEFFSFDIFHGQGACLNYSDMLTDLLNALNYDAATIINYVDKKTKNDYFPNIEVKMKKPKGYTKLFHSTIGDKGGKKIGNHACTLIKENSEYYIYDSTNLTMFECKNSKEAIHNIGTGKLTLNPYFSKIITNDWKVYTTIKDFCKADDYTCPYNRKNFIYTNEELIEMLNNNKALLDDFYNEIFCYIYDIVSETSDPKKIKKLIKET